MKLCSSTIVADTTVLKRFMQTPVSFFGIAPVEPGISEGLYRVRCLPCFCFLVDYAILSDQSSFYRVFTSRIIDLGRPSTVDKDTCPDVLLGAILAHASDDDDHTPQRLIRNACKLEDV